MKKIWMSIALLAMGSISYAQFDFNGQIIDRAEYRNGYGKIIESSQESAFSVNQRVRLQFQYKMDNLTAYASVQDVRTWGSTSQANVTDNFLSLHEGWVDYAFNSDWSMKLGRQELNYDNARFLGNLDWALQGRSHDFALLKYGKGEHKLHLGAGFNQDAEKLNGTTFTVANQYKSAQMVWYNYLKGDFELSLLFWNNGKQFVSQNPSISNEVRYTQTFGIPTLRKNLNKNTVLSGFAYWQTGKDVANKSVSAYDISAQISHTMPLAEAGKSMKFILGGEMISGTNSNETDKNNSFSPMYGTNHLYNGYMDYFFVGNRFENSVGLNDIYAKLRFDKNKFFTSAELHLFSSNADYYKGVDKMSKNLGTEIDLSAGWVLTNDVSFQLGYSHLFASNTLKAMQAATPNSTQNWAYGMLIIRPKSTKKFIGIYN